MVAIGAANYFINGISPQDTLNNHLKNHVYNFDEIKNYGIFDFCIGNKSIGQNRLHERVTNGVEISDTKLGKINRYYVSNEGNELIKILPPLEKHFLTATDKHKEKVDSSQMNIFDIIEEDVKVEPKNRETNIEAGWKCTLINQFKKQESYDINFDYYIDEINKLINFKQ